MKKMFRLFEGWNIFRNLFPNGTHRETSAKMGYYGKYL